MTFAPGCATSSGERCQGEAEPSPAGVECRGFAPHRDIDVLQHVLGLASVLQDTQADAEKLRRRVLVNDAQRGAIAAGNAREGGGKLAARGVCIHSRSSAPAGYGSRLTWQRLPEDVAHLGANVISDARGYEGNRNLTAS